MSVNHLFWTSSKCSYIVFPFSIGKHLNNVYLFSNDQLLNIKSGITRYIKRWMLTCIRLQRSPALRKSRDFHNHCSIRNAYAVNQSSQESFSELRPTEGNVFSTLHFQMTMVCTCRPRGIGVIESFSLSDHLNTYSNIYPR